MKELDIVKQVIKKAGQEILKYYKTDKYQVTYKKADDPVTHADLASEKIILEGLKDFNYGILSEETSEENDRLNQDKVWIIDPLDGTKDFIEQTDEFAVMIGLAEKGQAVLGAVYQPVIDKLFYAVKGQGAYQEQNSEIKKIMVNSTDQLSQSTMAVSRMHLGEKETEFAERTNIKNLISHGSAGLKCCLVAEGLADLYLSLAAGKTSEWDIGAADIILAEAGGEITDPSGNKIIYNKINPINPQGFIASNRMLHDLIINELKSLI